MVAPKEMAQSSGLSIAEMKEANELTRQTMEALYSGLDRIWSAMEECIDRGLRQTGELPGGLRIKRRARSIYEKLDSEWKRNQPNPLLANDWLSGSAMAVHEENASGGRGVTAPTNGAAGGIPATIQY